MKILDVKIDNLTIEEVIIKIDGFLKSEESHYIVTPNPEFLVKAQKDKEFKDILNNADLAVPDGIGLIFASYILNQPIKERVTGVDLMERICYRAVEMNWSVFLMGANLGIAEKAAENLRKKYPGLEIKAGFEEVIDQPEILFVALGAPKQEKWINDNLNKLSSVKLAIGIGGAFDFISGNIKRAPKFLRVIGLEWLWRFGCQPWRIKRIFNALIKFPWLVIKDVVKLIN